MSDTGLVRSWDSRIHEPDLPLALVNEKPSNPPRLFQWTMLPASIPLPHQSFYPPGQLNYYPSSKIQQPSTMSHTSLLFLSIISSCSQYIVLPFFSETGHRLLGGHITPFIMVLTDNQLISKELELQCSIQVWWWDPSSVILLFFELMASTYFNRVNW